MKKKLGQHIDFIASDDGLTEAEEFWKSMPGEAAETEEPSGEEEEDSAEDEAPEDAQDSETEEAESSDGWNSEKEFSPEESGSEAGEEPSEESGKTAEDVSSERKRRADALNADIAKAIEEETGRTEANDEIRQEYRIGDFTFQTFYEYRNAEADVKKIDIIEQELDLKDPEVAVRLYNDIRDGKITFQSPVGKKFFDHLADVVAEKSVGLLEDKEIVDTAEGKAKKQKILAVIVIILAIAAFGYYAYSEISDIVQTRKLEQQIEQRNKKGRSDLKGSGKNESDASGSQNGSAQGAGDGGAADNSSDTANLTILPEYEEMHEENPDMVGWIEIPGTRINYPVVQRSDDNSYYLSHAFDGSEDKNGCIFMDYRSSAANPTTNTILYGHNMASGLMFAELSEFEDQNFLEKNNKITFNTIYEKRTYQIVAVCLGEVEDSQSSSYRYYNFIRANTAQDFQNFRDYVQERNVFGGNVDLSETDQILTLSTCNHYIQDGRLFLVAKRVGQ